MKKFLIVVGGLFVAVYALLLVNDWLNLRLVFSSTNTPIYKMYRLFKECPKTELPIFGSSRAEAGFVPSELSTRAFNYGLSGSGLGETLLHVKAACARPDADVIIINLDPWGVGGLGNFQGDYSLAYGSSLLEGYEEYTKVAFVDRLPGTRFYGRFRPNLGHCMNTVLAATKRIDKGAILQRLSRNDEEWEYIISRCKPQRFNKDEEVWGEYKKLFAAHEKVNFVFVVSPVSKPWWERFEGKDDLAAFLKEISMIPNLIVLDMCSKNIERYDLSFYMDLTHLNETGARQFTRELRQELERRAILR